MTSWLPPGFDGYDATCEEVEEALAFAVNECARLSAEVDRLRAMTWKTRDQHPPTFRDGDRYLVAVPVRHTSAEVYSRWELSFVTVRCDEESFDIETCDGDVWDWTWGDVAYWIRLNDVIDKLPPVQEQADE